MAEHYLVQGHEGGVSVDIVYRFVADMIEEAEDLFVDAKDRLLEVSDWAKFGGINAIHFRLADGSGHAVRRHARRGDHILISQTKDAGGQLTEAFDSFTIDALEYDDYPDDNLETFAIRMHATGREDADDEGVKGTSTIVVARRDMLLSATYHGRSNAASNDGLWHELEESQWAALMKGLIEYYG